MAESADRSDPRARLGGLGEDIAARFLRARGAEILERNWRCRHGEIDLIVQHGSELVFVEVKTRQGMSFGDPVEAVTASKLARLRRLAGAWLAEHPGARQGVRLDVVGVLLWSDRAAVRHLVGVGG